MFHASVVNKHSKASPLSAALASLLLLAAGSSAALAQNADLNSGSVGTCNIKGTVSVTLLGKTHSYPLPCINKTQLSARGVDEKALVEPFKLDVPVLGDVIHLKLAEGRSDFTPAFNASIRRGLTQAAEFDALQGLIAVNALQGGLICEDSRDTKRVQCEAFTSVGAMLLNGQPVSLPPEIPLNHVVPITKSPVEITLPLLGTVISVPLSGAIVLNEVVVTGDGTPQLAVEHHPIHATLSGSLRTLGAGLVTVNVDITDATSVKSDFRTPYRFRMKERCTDQCIPTF